MELCLLCENELGKEPFVENPTEEAINNLLFRARERHKFRDNAVENFVSQTADKTAVDLINLKVRYHRKCYSDYANISKLERAKKRYNDAVEAGDPKIKPKKGRPSLEKTSVKEMLKTRSKSEPYIKTKCIICQEDKRNEKLHQVEFKATGDRMLAVASQLVDKSFFRRLNTISIANDAIANDVLYHNLCWAKEKKKVQPKTLNEPENYRKTLSEIELVKYVESYICDPSLPILDMNQVDSIYKDILIENGENAENLAKHYKRNLKELIKENIPTAVFIKSKLANKPEQIISEATNSEAENYTTAEDLQAMWKIAKSIRSDLYTYNWKIEGRVDSFKSPVILSTFIKWVIAGPRKDKKDDDVRNCQQQVDKITSILTQLVSQSFKSDRQIRYQSKSNNIQSRVTIETPLSVGVGLYVYHNTRSKKLINFLADLNIGINYKKVINLKKDIANAIKQQRLATDGVFVPVGFEKDQPTYFAIDNTDLKIDTPDGKNQLHGTAIAAYQQRKTQTQVKVYFKINDFYCYFKSI